MNLNVSWDCSVIAKCHNSTGFHKISGQSGSMAMANSAWWKRRKRTNYTKKPNSAVSCVICAIVYIWLCFILFSTNLCLLNLKQQLASQENISHRP